jgi:hypothetical protein
VLVTFAFTRQLLGSEKNPRLPLLLTTIPSSQ